MPCFGILKAKAYKTILGCGKAYRGQKREHEAEDKKSVALRERRRCGRSIL